MVLGDTLVLPGQLPAAKPTPPPQRFYRDVRRGGNLSPLYAGPYTVLDRGEKVFRLHVGERDETVSVDRLKPHTGAAGGTAKARSAASSTAAAYGRQWSVEF